MAETSLAGRVILVTGANGGLGAAVARAAAAAGAELILAGKREAELGLVYDAIVAAGGPEPILFPIDFTKVPEQAYEALAKGITTDCGRLDGIVHLAGLLEALTPLANTAIADWQRALHVNLTAPFAITQCCLPLLLDSPDAAVVFAADTEAAAPQAFWGGYAVAKSGLVTLLDLFALEHGHRENLRFNALYPGPTATALRARVFPAGDDRARPPEDAVAAFLYLLSAESRGSTGQVFSAQAINEIDAPAVSED